MQRIDAIGGVLTILSLFSILLYEFSPAPLTGLLAGLVPAAAICVFASRVRSTGRLFLLLGVALVILAAWSRDDWFEGIMRALRNGGFVVALLSALGMIRAAAMGSARILDCGRFLTRQPPGLRYLALTIGGHLFGLILLYGSIALLGSLAAESTRDETDKARRAIRVRRMVLAVQRGFVATLCWSPISFSLALSVALVPGASWAAAALPCFVAGLLMMATGWALDWLFKPRLPPPPVPLAVEPATGIAGWLAHLWPLFALLAVVVAGASAIYRLTGQEVVVAVMAMVPLVSLGWIALQAPGTDRLRPTAARAGAFVTRELPGMRNEIVLLFMAGFIGSLGSFLAVPLLQARGFDLSGLPPMLLVLSMIWFIPLTGQMGMNPILSVTLIIPMLPDPAAMGIDPVVLVAAITAGWAISGATSPFTASVLWAASLADVKARRLGLVWNGGFALAAGGVIALWVLALSWLLAVPG